MSKLRTQHPARSRNARLSSSRGRALGLALTAALFVAGCASLPGDGFAGSAWSVTGGFESAGVPATSAPATERGGSLSQRQLRILRAADELLETQNFVVSGYRYSYDCTGTILAIYALAGVNLVDLFPQYTGNGVARLYGIARDRALLYHAELPEPGDLIFWDNTYDKNGDTRWNDWLTHVGLVLEVSPDGTIDYLHHHYTKGVVRARMNLLNPETHLDPDGVIVNSAMRMRSHRPLNPDEWLSSHLYRELGAMHRIDL